MPYFLSLNKCIIFYPLTSYLFFLCRMPKLHEQLTSLVFSLIWWNLFPYWCQSNHSWTLWEFYFLNQFHCKRIFEFYSFLFYSRLLPGTKDLQRLYFETFFEWRFFFKFLLLSPFPSQIIIEFCSSGYLFFWQLNSSFQVSTELSFTMGKTIPSSEVCHPKFLFFGTLS